MKILHFVEHRQNTVEREINIYVPQEKIEN